MIEEQLDGMIPSMVMNQIIISLLIVAIGIFGVLAVRSRNIRSFQFQISVFIIVWIAGELVEILQDLGLFNFYDAELGMQIHLFSMIFFSAMLWFRFYASKSKQKKIVDVNSYDYF